MFSSETMSQDFFQLVRLYLKQDYIDIKGVQTIPISYHSSFI